MILVRLKLKPKEVNGHYSVTVEYSPSGERSEDTTLPFNGEKLGTLLKSLHLTNFIPNQFQGEDEIDWMIDHGLITKDGKFFSNKLQEIIGKWLYDSLLPEHDKGGRTELRIMFESALLDAEKQNEQLHIQLIFEADKAGQLADYPWELMHDGHNFLALRQVSFSRYIAYRSPKPNLPQKDRVNVLLISPNPVDPENLLLPLSDQEKQAIYRGLEKVKEVHILQPTAPTIDSVQEYLTIHHKKKDSPNIIHFDGHGVFGQLCLKCKTIHIKGKKTQCKNCEHPLPDPQGYLVFEDSNRGTDYISATEFSGIIHSTYLKEANEDKHGIMLVVLSACQSAVALGGKSIFNGVAQSLIGSRVPAVVAMQFPINAHAASKFSEQFYRSIGQKQSLSKAVRTARVAMGEEGQQWYRPVLYQRWQDNISGQLFIQHVGQRFSYAKFSFIGILILIFFGLGGGGYLFYQHGLNQSSRPEKMTGDFNIAIAEFSLMTQEGTKIESDLGEEKSTSWFNALEEEFELVMNNPDFPNTELWSPEFTGEILGETPASRAEFAQMVAEEINAHVIIYGVITLEDEYASVRPEFYVNAKGFESSAEIIGQYGFGKEIQISVEDKEFEINSRLVNRIKALSKTIIGMAYYADGNFEQAEIFLQNANEFINEDEGRDIVYLLIGNTYLLRASERHPDSFLEQAADYYEKALNVNCNECSRLRPMLGNLIINQRRALGDLDDYNFPLSIDSSKLAFVISGYENLILVNAETPLHGANIAAKANLGMGQIYQYLSLKQSIICECSVKFEDANQYLESVIKEYESGNESIQELASKAFVSLGWIAGYSNDAIAPILYQNAAVLAMDYEKAKYFYWVGSSYETFQEINLACETYEYCESFAKEFNDNENLELCSNAEQSLSCSNLNRNISLDYTPEYIPLSEIKN